MKNCPNTTKGFATVCFPTRIQSTAVRSLYINKLKVTQGLVSHRVVNSKLNQIHSLALPTKITPSVMLEERLGKLHKTCSSRGMFAEPKPESHFGIDSEQNSQHQAWVPVYINPKHGTYELCGNVSAAGPAHIWTILAIFCNKAEQFLGDKSPFSGKESLLALGRIPCSFLFPLHPSYQHCSFNSLIKATCIYNKIAWMIPNQQTLSSGCDPLNSRGDVLSLHWQLRDSKGKGHPQGLCKSLRFRGAKVSLKAICGRRRCNCLWGGLHLSLFPFCKATKKMV